MVSLGEIENHQGTKCTVKPSVQTNPCLSPSVRSFVTAINNLSKDYTSIPRILRSNSSKPHRESLRAHCFPREPVVSQDCACTVDCPSPGPYLPSPVLRHPILCKNGWSRARRGPESSSLHTDHKEKLSFLHCVELPGSQQAAGRPQRYCVVHSLECAS
jgi:hypothetical protein